MLTTRRWLRGSVSLLGLALLGCSSDVSQSDFSARFSRAVCDKAYECLDPAQLENQSSVYGLTRDQCPATYAAGSPLGCAPGQTLATAAVDGCIAALKAETCTLVKTSGAVAIPYACTSLCPDVTIDAGVAEDARALPRRDALDSAPASDGPAAPADAGPPDVDASASADATPVDAEASDAAAD